MAKIVLLVLLIIFKQTMFGQICIHTNLSKSLDFKTQLVRTHRANEYNDSCIITVLIIDKGTEKNLQVIKYTSEYLYDTVFKNATL